MTPEETRGCGRDLAPHASARLAAVAFAVALAAGACAASSHPGVERAEAAYGEAAADRAVATDAAAELRAAERALERARRELADGASEQAVEHYAYVAEQKVEVARAEAERKRHLRTAEEIQATRGDVVIDARTRAAAAARSQVRQGGGVAFDARRTDKGLVLTLGDTVFEPGGSAIVPSALHDLYRLAAFIADQPDRAVVVEGHTDDAGDAAGNRDLSQRRAHAVRDFLVSNGLPEERVTARGYGEEFPVAPNSNAAGRLQNRRVEVVVLDAGDEPLADAVLSRPPLGMQGR